MKLKREVKLGILVTVTLIIFIWGINYLSGTDLFTPQVRFVAVYDQIGGLTESNPVRISGVRVGQVSSIYFHPNGSGNVVVECVIDKQIQVPSNSVARLVSDFLGTREIEIALGTSSVPMQDGDTLRSYTQASIAEEVSRQMIPFRNQAENLLAQVDTILAVIQYTFTPQTRENIVQSIENISQTLASLQSTTQMVDTTLEAQIGKISVILSNTESITTNLRDNSQTFTRIMDNLAMVSDTLAAAEFAETLRNAGKSIEDFSLVMERIKRGEGSIGLLLTDEDLYRNLESSSNQLDLLLQQMTENPRRFFNFSIIGR